MPVMGWLGLQGAEVWIAKKLRRRGAPRGVKHHHPAQQPDERSGIFDATLGEGLFDIVPEIVGMRGTGNTCRLQVSTARWRFGDRVCMGEVG
jgi:hypothetical protein